MSKIVADNIVLVLASIGAWVALVWLGGVLSSKAITTIGLPLTIFNAAAILICWIRIIVFPKSLDKPG